MDKQKKATFEKINCLIFIMIFTFRSITDGLFIVNGVEGGLIVNIKYILIIVAILFILLNRKIEYKLINKEFMSVCIVCVLLFIISIISMLLNNKFYINLLLENLFKMILPIIYVYFFINSMSFDKIYISMTGALIGSFFGYILEIGIDNFTLANLKLLDFGSSYSPFESSFACGASIAFCAFFMYYRKNKVISFISLIFAILTFKRLSVIFALFLFIIPKFMNISMKIKDSYRIVFTIVFVCLTIIYFNLLLPKNAYDFYNIFGDTQNHVTMGRSEFLKSYLNKAEIVPGLGAIEASTGRNIEMDLIRIFLETSIIGLLIFTYGYWQCSGNKVYTYMYMCFQFLNLLTSHSLRNSFDWVLALITIFCISYIKEENFNYIKIRKS